MGPRPSAGDSADATADRPRLDHARATAAYDDMLDLLKESWASVQQELRSAAGGAAYEAWLADLRPVLLERSVVYLEAKSRMARDRVQKLFGPMLQVVLSREIGTRVQVELQERQLPGQLEKLEVSPQQPIIDDGNRTAWLVLKNLASGRPLPGTLFYFHGPRGVGKSFLLSSFHGGRNRGRRGGPRVFDLPQLLKAFQAVHLDKRVGELRMELVEPVVLVLDEVHRLAGKPKLQAFVSDVLRRRELAGRITVMASRWHPKEIHHCENELAGFLMSGFVAKVDPPGPIARLRYLRALEGAPSRNGRAKAIEELAQQPIDSYPELRAAWARSRDGKVPRRYLELVDPARVFQRVLDRVGERLGVETEELLGKGQGRQLSMARKVLAFLCVQEGLSRAEVGRFLARRSRAAISYMTKTLAADMVRKPEVRRLVEGLL